MCTLAPIFSDFVKVLIFVFHAKNEQRRFELDSVLLFLDLGEEEGKVLYFLFICTMSAVSSPVLATGYVMGSCMMFGDKKLLE
jgi:hypothetical protein